MGRTPSCTKSSRTTTTRYSYMKLLKQVTSPKSGSSRGSSPCTSERKRVRKYELRQKIAQQMEPELVTYVKEFRAKVTIQLS